MPSESRQEVNEVALYCIYYHTPYKQIGIPQREVNKHGKLSHNGLRIFTIINHTKVVLENTWVIIYYGWLPLNLNPHCPSAIAHSVPALSLFINTLPYM